MIELLSKLLDEKDPYPQVSASYLSDLAVAMGKRLGVSSSDLEALPFAARFYDIGKIYIGNPILQKKGPLSPSEWRAMKTHCRLGYQILKVGNLHQVANIIHHHHERWDGEGYPSAIGMDTIPMSSRIIAVLSAYRSMMSDRPWRKALGLRQTFENLRDGVGSQWDQAVVAALAAQLL
jgi:HD-GYP domain-containing protein (c-di-GMP phosphodiesterase class II)